MHTISHRALAPQEQRRLKEKVPSAARVVLSSIAFAAILSVPFIALVARISSRSPWLQELEHIGYGLVGVWVAYGLVRSVRRKWLALRPLWQDLMEGRVEVHRFAIEKVLGASESEFEMPPFLLQLRDGRTIIVDGETIAEQAEARRFPCTEFTLARLPRSRKLVALRCIGPYLRSFQSDENVPDIDWYRNDPDAAFEFIEPRDMAANASRSGQDKRLTAGPYRRLWSPELGMAAVATLIHVVLGFQTWKLANETIVNLAQDATIGRPCAPGKRITDPHIATCQEVDYPVLGTAAPQLWDSIQVNSPIRRGNGSDIVVYSIQTGFNTSWFWETAPAGPDKCRISSAKVHVQVQYLIPRWLDQAKAAPALQRRYAAWEAANWAYLDREMRLELEGAKEYEHQALELPPEDCTSIELRAQALGSETFARKQALRTGFSADTKDVLTADASRNWMKAWREAGP